MQSNSHDLTRTCFPGLYWVLPWEYSLPKAVSSNLGPTDGLTVLARIEIVAILVHYQPSYNTSHTQWTLVTLLLAEVTLWCGMYPAVKVVISHHLTPRLLRSDSTVGKPSVDAGSLCSEVDLLTSGHQISPSLSLALQGPQKTQQPFWVIRAAGKKYPLKIQFFNNGKKMKT